MTLTVQENESANRFEAVDESGVVAGFVEYRERDGHRILVHTEVDDAFEGQGVGSSLARESVEQSLSEGVDLVVTCPFIVEYLERHPELAEQVTLQ
ncbi:MAG: GNAT family N-acetyltransferase [Nocardioides sp.]